MLRGAERVLIKSSKKRSLDVFNSECKTFCVAAD